MSQNKLKQKRNSNNKIWRITHFINTVDRKIIMASILYKLFQIIVKKKKNVVDEWSY